jgi:hypothetical protein
MRKEIMETACSLRNNKLNKKAIGLLSAHPKMIRKYPSMAGLLATLYFDIDDYKNSAKWYGVASKLSPHSEMASLGLFHTLWDTGKLYDAFEEMKRFMDSHKSKEYKQLKKELS